VTAEEPTQLDRIEAKLDEVLRTRLRVPRVDRDAIRREFTAADRERSQLLFLADEPTAKPKWGRWKTAAATIGLILGFACLAVGSWWLWGVFIRMHC
jgi:hypothetical protein